MKEIRDETNRWKDAPYSYAGRNDISKMTLLAMFSSVKISSVAQSYPTLCYPMNRSMPGFPVHYQFPELAQTHRANDTIQPSHPFLSPSPPAFNLSQHQSLFK